MLCVTITCKDKKNKIYANIFNIWNYNIEIVIGNDHQNSISTNSTDKCQSNKKQLKVQIISEKNSVKKAQRKLHFLSNFNLALFPLIFLSDLLLLSFNQLKLLDIEFLHEETKKKNRRITLPRGSNFNAMQWSLIEKREWLEKWRYLFSRERDLADFFFSFLADKSHHLVDLLRDITIVHFRRRSTGKQVRQWPTQVDMFHSLILRGPAKLLLNMQVTFSPSDDYNFLRWKFFTFCKKKIVKVNKHDI